MSDTPSTAPRRDARFRRGDGKALLFAHRGARVELPENTLEAFARAIEVGADAIETDVHLTADGEVIVFHDADAFRLADRRRLVAACTRREVQSWDVGHAFRGPGGDGDRPFVDRGFRAPLLADVLAAFPDTPFNVDLKPSSPALVAAAVRVVRDRGADERVLLTSFDGRNAARARALGYRGPTGSGTQDVLRLLATARSRLAPGRHPADAVQIPFRTGPVWTPLERVLARCRAVGARLDVFTVNDARLAREFVALGVDGLMTDDPAQIARALGRRTPAEAGAVAS